MKIDKFKPTKLQKEVAKLQELDIALKSKVSLSNKLKRFFAKLFGAE